MGDFIGYLRRRLCVLEVRALGLDTVGRAAGVFSRRPLGRLRVQVVQSARRLRVGRNDGRAVLRFVHVFKHAAQAGADLCVQALHAVVKRQHPVAERLENAIKCARRRGPFVEPAHVAVSELLVRLRADDIVGADACLALGDLPHIAHPLRGFWMRRVSLQHFEKIVTKFVNRRRRIRDFHQRDNRPLAGAKTDAAVLALLKLALILVGLLGLNGLRRLRGVFRFQVFGERRQLRRRLGIFRLSWPRRRRRLRQRVVFLLVRGDLRLDAICLRLDLGEHAGELRHQADRIGLGIDDKLVGAGVLAVTLKLQPARDDVCALAALVGPAFAQFYGRRKSPDFAKTQRAGAVGELRLHTQNGVAHFLTCSLSVCQFRAVAQFDLELVSANILNAVGVLAGRREVALQLPDGRL